MPLSLIIHEHRDFILVNKPENINFHSEDGPGIVAMMESALQCKLYTVHRLDKMTSGLLILATSTKAAARFTQMFETRRIEKYYLAISLRKPKKSRDGSKAIWLLRAAEIINCLLHAMLRL